MNDSKRELALAKVGMRALVDEATGFQYQREDDDLRQYAYAVGLEDAAELIDARIRESIAAQPPASQGGDETP